MGYIPRTGASVAVRFAASYTTVERTVHPASTLTSWIVAPEAFRTGSEKTIRMARFMATPTAPGPGLRLVIVGRFLSSVGLGVGLAVGLGVGLAVAVGVGLAVAVGVGLAVAVGVGADAPRPPGTGGDTMPAEGRADAGSTAARSVVPKSGAPDRTAMLTGTAMPTATPTTSMSITTSLPIPQSGTATRYLLFGLVGPATDCTRGGSGVSRPNEEASAEGRPARGGVLLASKSYWHVWQWRSDPTRWVPHL